MRLTRRGRGIAVVVGFCILMALGYGARSLNALVAPLVIVLVGAAVSVYRTPEPVLERGSIGAGFVGEDRTVRLQVETETPTAAVVTDTLGDGLSSDENVLETTLVDGRAIRYDVTLDRRGEHAVGPTTVTVRDVLGVVEKTVEYGTQSTVLVYPEVHDLRGASARDLELLTNAVRKHHREELSHLREYERGDTLRDVHWKSTAKRPEDELIVKEFVADRELGTIEIYATADAGLDDEMASAAASIVTYLLDRGVAVGITAPNGRHDPRVGGEHHRAVLRLLALTGAGATDPERRDDADIVVDATGGDTTIVVDGHEIPFDRLRGADGGPLRNRIDSDTSRSNSNSNSHSRSNSNSRGVNA